MMQKTIFAFSIAAGLLSVGPLPLRAQDDATPIQTVDALNKIYGSHPGFRANHAKGVVVEGHFKASPAARKLSRAIIFNGKSFPVTVRFSDAGGLPTIPDGSANANPHGMAIKFHLPGGEESDIVINSLKFFPVATGEEFRDLLLAIADSPATAAKPTKLDQFVASHPAVPKAFATVSAPGSFADEEYYGIDAFIFVDKSGHKQAIRYIMQPQQVVHLTPAEAERKSPDYLVDDLPQRVSHKAVVFRLKAQLSNAEDSTSNPTIAWPSDRKIVELGVLTLTKYNADSLGAQKALLFLPGRLTDGIELSDDPLVTARNAAYAVSFSRRAQ